MSASDRKFFRRFQHRKHRVRLSDPDEIKEFAAATGCDLRLPPGCRWYTCIRKIGPDLRVWVLALNCDCEDDVETEFPEEEAKEIYEAHCGPREF